MKVAIYGQYYKPEDKEYLEELFKLLKIHTIYFVVEQNYYNSFKNAVIISKPATFTSFLELDNTFNFMFTVGGDGTILRAVTFVRDSNIPIVGINTGRLGFLATVQKDEISNALNKLLNNDFLVKQRSLLQVSTNPSSIELETLDFALNEVTVSRKNTASMITIETLIDDEYLTSYWADGLIISTPTGSTGYSLSCGGPIITPQARSFAITPIAPHNLNARPLVIPEDSRVKLKISGREDEFFLSLDSRIITVKSHTEICINKAEFTLKMVQIDNQTFIKTLREKLLWGQDTRN